MKWQNPLRDVISRVDVRHPVVRNALALYGVQAARYLIPLALVPFLARVLRPDAYGRLAFAQSLATLLVVVAEFGFLLSATREVARQRGDADALRSIAAAVLGAKIFLAGVVATLGIVALLCVPDFQSIPTFIWGACFLAVAQASSPAWFFQGIEAMGRQTGIEVLGSAAGAAIVFAYVRRPEQAATVLFVFGATLLCAAAANHVRMYRRIGFEVPQLRASLEMLHRSLALFFLKASIALYTGANAFLLGLFVAPAVVADFAGAEKVMRASLSLFSPATQALYPRMSHLMAHNRSRGIRLAKVFLVGYATVGTGGAAVLVWAAPWIVRVLLGPGYENAVPLLRWLAALLPVIAVSNVLGIQIMLPLGMDRATNLVIGGAAAANLLGMVILVPRFGAIGMVWSVLGSEVIVTSGMAVFLALHRASRRRAALSARA